MDINKIFDAPPIFETERLILRKIELSDAVDYYELASDQVVSAETLWDRHITLHDTTSYLERLNSRFNAQEAIHWGIIDKSINKLIGRTGLIHIDPFHEKAELGYALSSHYWGKGIITEATREVIKFSFTDVGFNRIEGRCNDNNPGSYRVMEKLGMTCEGMLRKQLKIKGEFVDQKMYAILKSDVVQPNMTSK